MCNNGGTLMYEVERRKATESSHDYFSYERDIPEKHSSKDRISTFNRKVRIINLLPALNDAKIAREVGVSREWVRQVRTKKGIPSPYPWLQCSIISEEMLGKLLLLLDKKLSVAQAVREIKGWPLSLTATYRVLKNHNILVKDYLRGPKTFTLKKVETLLAAHMTINKIAEQLHTSYQTIFNWKKKMGLTRKQPRTYNETDEHKQARIQKMKDARYGNK